MSLTGYCGACQAVRRLREVREGDQPALWCQTCGQPVDPAQAGREERPAPPPLILYIDDDRLLLRLFSDALEEVGFRTTVAPDGPTGLAVAKRERPAAIIVDFIMPVMDGLEVCRRLRAEPDLQATPILLLTAVEKPEMAAQAREAGATFTLQKTFGADPIVEAVARVLGGKPGAAPL